jgi:hypothetical protein
MEDDTDADSGRETYKEALKFPGKNCRDGIKLFARDRIQARMETCKRGSNQAARHDEPDQPRTGSNNLQDKCQDKRDK